jgi:hypothetical protein
MKRFLMVLVVVMLALFPAMAIGGSATATAQWEQDIPAGVELDGWRLWVSDVQGGPYDDGQTYFRDATGNPVDSIWIPYGGTPGATYTTAVTIVAPDNVKTTLYFVLNAWNSTGPSEDSNEASGEFDFTQAPSAPFTLIITVTKTP